jgi:Phasin protein
LEFDVADGTQQSNTIHAFRADARAAERSSAQAAGNVARQGAEAMHRASNAAGESMRRGAQAVAEGQRELSQDAAEQFADMSQKVAQAVQGTTEHMRELMVLPNAARGGLQDLQQGVTGLFEEIVRTNVRATQELFRLYNPGAAIELQQRFAREYLDALMEGSATLIRAARRTADETLRPLEQQVEQRRQARQDEQRYQLAAE